MRVSLTVKDGTVLGYFCPVMGGHLFLDENFGQGYVVTEEDEVYLMFSRKKRRLFFPYDTRIHSVTIENTWNISLDTKHSFR